MFEGTSRESEAAREGEAPAEPKLSDDERLSIRVQVSAATAEPRPAGRIARRSAGRALRAFAPACVFVPPTVRNRPA